MKFGFTSLKQMFHNISKKHTPESEHSRRNSMENFNAYSMVTSQAMSNLHVPAPQSSQHHNKSYIAIDPNTSAQFDKIPSKTSTDIDSITNPTLKNLYAEFNTAMDKMREDCLSKKGIDTDFVMQLMWNSIDFTKNAIKNLQELHNDQTDKKLTEDKKTIPQLMNMTEYNTHILIDTLKKSNFNDSKTVKKMAQLLENQQKVIQSLTPCFQKPNPSNSQKDNESNKKEELILNFFKTIFKAKALLYRVSGLINTSSSTPFCNTVYSDIAFYITFALRFMITSPSAVLPDESQQQDFEQYAEVMQGFLKAQAQAIAPLSEVLPQEDAQASKVDSKPNTEDTQCSCDSQAKKML